MIDIIIPKKPFIILYSALVYCGTPSWFVESEYYRTNTRSFFSIIENDYTIVDNEKTEIRLSDQFFKLDQCPVCKNNKYGLVAHKYPLIGLRKLKSCKGLKEYDVILGDLNLPGWVILKSDENFNDDLNEPLAKLCAREKGLLGKVGKHWWTKKNFIPVWF